MYMFSQQATCGIPHTTFALLSLYATAPLYSFSQQATGGIPPIRHYYRNAVLAPAPRRRQGSLCSPQATGTCGCQLAPLRWRPTNYLLYLLQDVTVRHSTPTPRFTRSRGYSHTIRQSSLCSLLATTATTRYRSLTPTLSKTTGTPNGE